MTPTERNEVLAALRHAMAEALFSKAESLNTTVDDACYVGATGWLFCQLVHAAKLPLEGEVMDTLIVTMRAVVDDANKGVQDVPFKDIPTNEKENDQ